MYKKCKEMTIIKIVDVNVCYRCIAFCVQENLYCEKKFFSKDENSAKVFAEFSGMVFGC